METAAVNLASLGVDPGQTSVELDVRAGSGWNSSVLVNVDGSRAIERLI